MSKVIISAKITWMNFPINHNIHIITTMINIEQTIEKFWPTMDRIKFDLNLMRRRKWSQNLLEWFFKMYTNRFKHYLWCLIQQNHLKSVFQVINSYWRHFPCTPIVHIHLHPAARPTGPNSGFLRNKVWDQPKSNSTGCFEIEFRKQKVRKCTSTKSAKDTVFSGVRTIYIKTDIR